MVRVAVDWLVVSAATMKTANANRNLQSVTHAPTVSTMYFSWAEMNVAVSQAIPNSAMAEIMPALKTDCSGTVLTLGRPTNRMIAPTTNITRTMVVVMSIGTAPSPSTSKAGRRSGNSPSRTIATTPSRNTKAELRPCVVKVSREEADVPSEPGAEPGGRLAPVSSG